MKIFVVCQYYYPEPFRITDICETLAKKGHNVTVLTGLPNYPEGIIHNDYKWGKKRIEFRNGVRIIRTTEIGRGKSRIQLFMNYFSFVLSASIRAFFMKEEFDVVFSYQLSPVMMCVPAILYSRKKKKKFLLYCLDIWPDSLAAGGIKEESLIFQVFLWISRKIYTAADKILVTSKMFINYFNERFENIKDIKHLPQYAEDLFSFEPERSDHKESFNLVFAGNIGDMQSIDTIILAANELKAYHNIFFHIVGEGSKLENCKHLSDELGLKNITFYGRRPVEEMPKFYELADAMLITLRSNKTLSYTLPGKLQSYMAAAKPILGAINGEARLVIEESGCGLCCEAEDYSAYAHLILKFCNMDNKEMMGRASKEYYLKNYKKEIFIKNLEKELSNLGV